MSDPFIAEIRMFAGNFAPRSFAFCSGQIMPIQQNTALFSLLGTTYGGNGTSTFALPDLRGRIANGFGQGPGLAQYTQGEVAGVEAVTLLLTEIPQHSHGVRATTTTGNLGAPAANSLPATPAGSTPRFYSIPGAAPFVLQNFANTAISLSGGNSLPHSNLMPTLCVTFIICLNGVFPARN